MDFCPNLGHYDSQNTTALCAGSHLLTEQNLRADVATGLILVNIRLLPVSTSDFMLQFYAS